MIPHNRPTLGSAETEAARRTIESGWLAQGREVAAFEQEICTYLGLPEGHAVALSSGTAALFMALWALDAAGKRVAIPVYSCAALRNAALMAGAIPMPVDVARDTPNIDLSAAVKGGAQIAVAAHMFGVPSRSSAEAETIPLIEDCCQALGARIDGQPVGLTGSVGVFSFYATKMITSGGQGGMLVSRDKALVDVVRDYREFDCRADRQPRFNFQMTDLQASIGRVQLARLDEFLTRRRVIYGRYRDAGLPLWPGSAEAGIEPCNFRAIVRTAEPGAVRAALDSAGIRGIVPIEDWELLGDIDDFPEAAILARTAVSLPIFPSMDDSDVTRVIQTLQSNSVTPFMQRKQP